MYKRQPGISIPADATEVSINKQGEVQAKQPGQVTPSTVGQLELSSFFNEAGLDAQGDNLFLETPASGAAQNGSPGSNGYGTILQGFVETANVNPVAEITALISAQRAYEMNSKVISASDEMLSATVNLRR